MAEPRVPSKFACLAVSTVLALAGWFAVGVATQPDHDPGRLCRTIEGLVLDGGSVSTTAPAPLLVVEPIPRRDIDDQPLPGLILARCGYEAIGRRCTQTTEHEGLHRLVAERTLQYRFRVLSWGLLYAMVCTDLDDADATRKLNSLLPTGISSDWQICEYDLADRPTPPTSCPSWPATHRHITFNC